MITGLFIIIIADLFVWWILILVCGSGSIRYMQICLRFQQSDGGANVSSQDVWKWSTPVWYNYVCGC